MEYDLVYSIANDDDLPQLQKLGEIAYSEYLPVLDEDGRNKLLSSITKLSTYRDLMNISTVFICRTGNMIVGMAFYVPAGNPTDIYETNWSYIRFVAIHPAYAGRGIAKQLTQMCIDKAAGTGESIIALHTSEFMDAARHIYEKIGFIQLKEIPLRFGKRYWLYTLSLNMQQ